MPARRPKKPRPSTVGQIKTNDLVLRLQQHSLTHPNNRKFVSQYMSPSQVTAAVALLRKVIPDLAAHKIDVSGDVRIEVLQVADHKIT